MAARKWYHHAGASKAPVWYQKLITLLLFLSPIVLWAGVWLLVENRIYWLFWVGVVMVCSVIAHSIVVLWLYIIGRVDTDSF